MGQLDPSETVVSSQSGLTFLISVGSTLNLCPICETTSITLLEERTLYQTNDPQT